MASSLTHVSVVFPFLLVLAISSRHAHARPSQAARRATRETVGSAAPVVVPEDSPAVQVEKAAKFTSQFPTTSASTKKHGHDYNNWAGGYKGGEEYFGEEQNNYFTAADSSGSKESSNTVYRPNYGNRKEHHGMSDTRFLEDGKYYYDINNEQGYGFYAGIGVEGGNRGYETYSREGNANEYYGEPESKEEFEP